MTTIIVSCHINDQYIALQKQSIAKYFTQPYQYIVFNDAKDTADLTSFNIVYPPKIQSLCESLGIEHIRIPQSLHSHRNDVFSKAYTENDDHYVSRCALATQFATNYARKNFPDAKYLLIIDCDMFFINSFNIEEYMQDIWVAGVTQARGHFEYVWNGLFICRLDTPQLNLLSWEAGKVEDVFVDVGGHSIFFLRTLPSEKFKAISNDYFKEDSLGVPVMVQLQNIDSAKKPFPTYLNKELLLDRKVLHIRGGGNWTYLQKVYYEACCDIISQYVN